MKSKMPSLFVIMMDMVMMYVMMVMIVTTYQASALLAAELGFTRILTSGGAATALQVDDHLLHHHYHHHLHHHQHQHHRHHENDQGAVTIADLVSELPDVNVMPGGGISEENMAEVIMIMMAMAVMMIMIMMAMMKIMMVMAMVMVMIMIIVMAVIMTEMNMPEAFQRRTWQMMIKIVLMMKTMTSISSCFFEDINLLVIKMHDVKNSILKIPDHGGHKSSGVSRIGEVNFYKYKSLSPG